MAIDTSARCSEAAGRHVVTPASPTSCARGALGFMYCRRCVLLYSFEGRGLICYLLARDRPNITLISETLAPASRDALFQLTHSRPRGKKTSRTRHTCALPAAPARSPSAHRPPVRARLARCVPSTRARIPARLSRHPDPSSSPCRLSAPARRISARTRTRVRENARIRATHFGVRSANRDPRTVYAPPVSSPTSFLDVVLSQSRRQSRRRCRTARCTSRS
jgi:hypothetical protein